MRGKRISLAIKISLLIMAVSSIGISILAYLSYSQAKRIFMDHTLEIVQKNIEKYETEINKSIDRLIDNIQLLSYNPSVIGYYRAYYDPHNYDEVNNKTLNQYEADLKNLFRLVLIQDEALFQIRLLNAQGFELLKLIKKEGNIVVVPRKGLQDKSHRSYFLESLNFGKDDVFISDIDLNKEFGTIEFPIKPTLRVAKPIFLEDRRAGLLVINVNVAKLFSFDELRNASDEYTYIADYRGFYIFNWKEPSKEFGFDLGYDYKIYKDFPEVNRLYEDPELKYVSFIDEDKGIISGAKKVFITPNKFLVIMKQKTTESFQQKASVYVNTLGTYIFVITVVITTITIIMVRKLTFPIVKLTTAAQKIAETKGRELIEIDVKSNDEIGELAESFRLMLKELIKYQEELKNFAQKLEKEVEEKTKELRKLNENLQKEVEKKVQELRQKDRVLIQQSRLAAMGEMIGAIAHQWRQPLNYLALNVQLLEEMAEQGRIDKELLKEFSEKIMNTVKFMSTTIDDFRTFFRKDKEKVIFDLKEAVEKTIELLKPQLEHRGISIEERLESVKVEGFKNEFRQAVLNLITNARDAVEKRMTEEGIKGKIEVEVKRLNGKALVVVRDNGGGIPEDIKDRIFEPYFTTKEEGKGTGLGLYMAKEIIERMGGRIWFRNTEEGAEFVIELAVKDEDKAQ